MKKKYLRQFVSLFSALPETLNIFNVAATPSNQYSSESKIYTERRNIWPLSIDWKNYQLNILHGSLNPNLQIGFIEKKESLKPLQYIQFKKEDIYYCLTKENPFTIDKANEIYNKLIATINTLTTIRQSEKLTGEILRTLEKLPDIEMRLTQYWIIKAIKYDDSYVYAYNSIAQIVNGHYNEVFILKVISEIELFKLLESEKNNQVNDQSSIDNTTNEVNTCEVNSKKIGEVQKPIITENVFCPKMDLKIPRKHFKVFTENNSKNGKPFLTIEELDSFIARAFCGHTELPKQKFNQGTRELSLIQHVFYGFYSEYYFDYFETLHCQPQFIRLLTDNFEGWNFEKVQANFKTKPKKHL